MNNAIDYENLPNVQTDNAVARRRHLGGGAVSCPAIRLLYCRGHPPGSGPRHREAVPGLPEARRQERIRLLRRLFDLFEGHDAEEEVRQLKEQDEGFR